MKGARRPTRRVVQFVPLKAIYRPVNQVSDKQKLRPQLLYIDTRRTQLFSETHNCLFHTRNMYCQIYTSPPGCQKSRTMLLQALSTPGFHLIASPRTETVLHGSADWLVLRSGVA